MSLQWPTPQFGWPGPGPERDEARRMFVLARRLRYLVAKANSNLPDAREIASLKWAISELEKLFPAAAHDVEKCLAAERAYYEPKHASTSVGADEQQPSDSGATE